MTNNEYIIIQFFGNDYIAPDSNSNDYRFQCPHCKELGKRTDDYKLYVHKGNLKFHCFRCGWKGRLSRSDALEEGSSSKLLSRLNELVKSRNVSEDEDEETIYYRIPENLVQPSDINAYNYLKGRGITDEDIKYYSIRMPNLSDSSKFMGRIVIPNKVIAKVYTDMYVARTYIGQEPKYKNPYNSPKDSVIFNYSRIPKNPEQIIINEGTITSIIAGRDSIATYGKSVSDTQISMICDLNPKKIYVSLDNDAKDDDHPDATMYKTVSLIRKLLDKLPSAEIYLVEMPPGKDAVDVGRDMYRSHYIKSAVRISNHKFLDIYSRISYLKDSK